MVKTASMALGETVKALTVKQPWAHLLMTGRKDVENRSRMTRHRGRVAIHVAVQPSVSGGYLSMIEPMVGAAEHARLVTLAEKNPDAGLVVGVADLVDCTQDSQSQWAIDGLWHWEFANPRWFDIPEPAVGRLGLWRWQPASRLKGVHWLTESRDDRPARPA